MTPEPTSRRFQTFAWAFLVYLVMVILFGAWVRITGSGAGCGSHWPTCHGQLVPTAPDVKTLIEYTHRLTSGLCGVFGLIAIAWTWRAQGARSGAFKASLLTMFFILLEGGIGAGLVLKELVERDDSVARAVVISLHLVNTMALTGAAAAMAMADGRGYSPWRRVHPVKWLFVLAVVLITATNMSGAVTALGDTLFPTAPALGPGLFDKVREDLSPANHFLVRLRSVHPILAVITAAYLLTACQLLWTRARALAPRLTALLVAGVLGQVLLGLINIALAAPGWMQLVHLLGANLVWLTLFSLFWRLLSQPATPLAHAR